MNYINKDNWIKYFPYKEPRGQQENVINSVLNAFKEDKKYAIVECGTGVGKSAIGVTISEFMNRSSLFQGDKIQGSYFLTTQKVLQEQYEKDFNKTNNLISLYSSSNYKCSRDSKASCKDISTAMRANSLGEKYEKCKYECVYKQKKKDFIDKYLGVTNFSYFLTEKNYSNQLPNKKVLVIDEAHNLENELTRFIEISVSEYFSEKVLKLKVPELKTKFQAFSWIKKTYYDNIKRKVLFFQQQLEKFGISSSKLDEFKKITNKYDQLNSHMKKIEKFIILYDKDNWVFNLERSNNGRQRKLVFKPIDVSSYAKQHLLDFADYIIFMSATIISHEGFAESIGIKESEYISVKEGSPFDPENNPILFTPSGSMSAKNIEKTLPVMLKMVKQIISEHSREKGIIHTHNTRIAKYLNENLNSNRIILAYGENREKALKAHLSSKNPTILISPSMSEGVDLKGELSRFQVLCKVPFPYLGDKVTKKKMNKWSWWYNTQTVRVIIQSIGRSIRNENDKAVTYILDSDWSRIKSRSKELFPKGFFRNYHEY